MEPRSQKKVSTACSYCKVRKRKCSATFPCTNCVINGQKCVYGEFADGRRKESIRRARQESTFHKEVLQRLLERIKTGRDEEIRSLVVAHASLEQIATYLGVPAAHVPTALSDSGAQSSMDEQEPHDDSERISRPKSSEEHMPYVTPGYVEVFGNLSFSAAIPSAGYDSESQTHQISNFRVPEYMVQPLHFPDQEGSMTSFLTSFRDRSRRDLAEGMSADIVLGPETVNLEVALRGCRDNDYWTPSTWACEVQRQFPELDKLTRLTSVYFLALYMRWHISPTAENYALLPECMRPSLSQRLIPHHAAIDVSHHPSLREIMILEGQKSGPNGEERIDVGPLQVAGLRPPWESDIKDAVVIDAKTGFRTLSPEFIDAINCVEKWHTGRALLHKFPQLEDKMHFVEDDILTIDNQQLHDIDWG